ncbi:hypothetical protein L917_14984 [Phytophthora nicotianae]|uniref:NAD-dependent epimerase/dehydratase domain-containing protein n=2 Tax=Phytophthora nicotianae TaxID=4792 RepID=W2KLF4_PHYNI|nr:hypothetical protein L917_14984 [Phytophthora nicotianae]ETO67338.1 hypothetical protein F444_15699 [Phytophthora nicotianae P1976]
MARVLVLGGTSYVAQFVLQRLQQDGTLRVVSGDAVEEIEAVACTIRSQPFAPLPPGFVTVKADSAPMSKRVVRAYWQVNVQDLRTLDNCIEDFRPTVVINCAAISSPAVCQQEPEKASAINEPRGLVALLGALTWPVRFVHLSTDFVYEGTQPNGASYHEDDAILSPDLSAYGSGKLRFDHFLLKRDSSTHLQVWILRIANVVGPGAPLFPDKSAPKFMEWLHHQLFQLENAAPLNLWSDEFRSYLYVFDLIEIMFKLLAIDPNEHTTLVNVGGVESLSRVELGHKYLAATAKHNPKASAAISRHIAPTSRAQVDLGYPSPLNTKLNTSRLANLLPNFIWTPTDKFLDEISRSFLA